jgi:nitroimidazol reductase NimA-like FMN-containing flavoprotein (pyridoxamine 5'-phosphate oxidase superfamily)
MTMPVTTLDPRFSDPAATATSWDETSKALETAGLFWISTVRADGRPHVTPLVAVWVNSVLYFCTGAAEQKAINLGANPHVVLTTGCNGWEGGLDVMVEGDAVRVTDDAALSRLAQAWTTKWDGRWHYEVRSGVFHHPGSDEAVLVFAVAPAKVLAFTKGTFSHTQYRF